MSPSGVSIEVLRLAPSVPEKKLYFLWLLLNPQDLSSGPGHLSIGLSLVGDSYRGHEPLNSRRLLRLTLMPPVQTCPSIRSAPLSAGYQVFSIDNKDEIP